MELLSEEIFNLKLKPNSNDFIQKFSELSLDNLGLEQEVLIGQIYFTTHIQPVINPEKKYFIAVTSYVTEKNFKMLFPFNVNLKKKSTKATQNPKKYYSKILRENYGFTKKNTEEIQIFEFYNHNNIIIYGVNVPCLKKLRDLKVTKCLHFYSEPEFTTDLKELYSQVLVTKLNGLKKRFNFMYDNIRISLKEKHIIERII